MLTPQEYLATLSMRARTQHDAWWLVSERTGTPESRRAKLLATLRFYGEEAQAADLQSRLDAEPLRSELSSDLRDVVDQTAQDLAEYVAPTELQLFRSTAFGLLPLSGVDAFCVDRSPDGVKLDGYLVVLNEGLFVCAQLLSKSLLLESLDGDLAQYKQSGLDAYRTAIGHFLAPSSQSANKVFFDGVPPDIEGALSAVQMRMTILLLQFLMLREMGHVVHQDHALMEQYQFHIAGVPAPLEATAKHWDSEYEADSYALERILGHTGSDAGKWANFVGVYVFFHWLGSIERATGKPLCPLHPPPLQRGEELRMRLAKRVPQDPTTASLVERSLEVLAGWSARI